VSSIDVLVVSTTGGYNVEGIVAAVAARPDMTLVAGRFVTVEEVDALLAAVPASRRCAVVLVTVGGDAGELDGRWLAERADLVVLHVDVVDEVVRFALRDPRLDSLLGALRELVESVATGPADRVARVELRAVPPPPAPPPPASPPTPLPELPRERAPQRPLLAATAEWVRHVLRGAVARVPDKNGDLHGLSLTKKTLLQSLDGAAEEDAAEEAPELADVEAALVAAAAGEGAPGPAERAAAEAALDAALAAADPAAEPLAVAWRVLCSADRVDFRVLALALAPELDHRFQRCMGFLLDEMGRRVGSLGLFAVLLGPSGVAGGVVARERFARWLVFEGHPTRPPAADEPLRIDPFLAHWLLGERGALADDPRLRRLLRSVRWLGADLLQRQEERANAAALGSLLQAEDARSWLLLGGDDPAGWRALLELAAEARRAPLVRVEPAALAGADLADVEEAAVRLGRLARLTGGLLVVDVAAAEEGSLSDDALRLFLAALARTGCRGAAIGRDEARLVRLLGGEPYRLADELALSRDGRVAALRAAAGGADSYLGDQEAAAMASRFPLHLDGFELAMRLASGRPLDFTADEPRLQRFAAACKQVAAAGISSLAERIEPVFSLDEVVLPPDRSRQLVEIVDNVRLAAPVLEGWKFGAQLPYGRGVSALFFGPSGTGKTMAAMGIARRLGVEVLRLDFSRVVSKYIGDTEKNIDRVFTDAQRSGAAILIDEADALLGKRSEVKDAHDRYANIEVAYLLQRMEAYEGLAILTTNMRQNLDPAFLRRLRFVVDFPRPDVAARERIWRQCLPPASHQLDDAAFRQLARRLDLTGGHIRQITLRAAFLAAAGGERIHLGHVAQAAGAELAKLGMAPVELDLAKAWEAA
jgi:hypothetical protein